MTEEDLEKKCRELALDHYKLGGIQEVTNDPEAALRLYRKAAELDKHTALYVQAVNRIANKLTIFHSHQ